MRERLVTWWRASAQQTLDWHCHEAVAVAVAFGLLALWTLLYVVTDEWLVSREYHALQVRAVGRELSPSKE